MLDLSRVELQITPSPPYGEWIRAIRLMGYWVVGLALPEADALAFQTEAGDQLRCFVRAPAVSLPWVDSCRLDEARKRRRPPELLVIGTEDEVSDVDAYLGARPNRVEVLELSLAEIREAYEAAPSKTFEWSSRLVRLASAKGIPVLASSSATSPAGLVTPLTKSVFATIMRAGRRSAGIRERRFLGRLDQVVSTRRRPGAG